MKKRILATLVLLFAIFACGSLALVLHVSSITRSLGGLIQLHEVEHLRQNLVIYIQTVQADLYRVRTPMAQDLDLIVANVAALDRAAKSCQRCHHAPEVTKALSQIGELTDRYEDALSYYITAAAGQERIESLKLEGTEIGDRLLALTQQVALAASRSLQRSTTTALARIDQARGILLVTLGLASVFALAAGAYLVRFLTRPIQALLSGTRAIRAGELGYAVAYEDRTEFGELARNFNAMSAALKQGADAGARQQEALRESERKFRTLTEYSLDWVYWVGAAGELVYMSPTCEEVTGYPIEAFAADPDLIRRIVHEEDRAAFDAHVDLAGAGRHPEFEFRIVTRSGEVCWISHVCGPIRHDANDLGRFAANRDVTGRKRLEEQLAQSRKMESLGLLAGGVAHDFNNLLTAILGYSSLLEARLASDERNGKAVAQITRAAERAQELTSSLLAFSRKQIIRTEVVDLNEVVAGLAGLLGRLIGEDIEFVVAPWHGALPALIDTNQIEHVLINLVTNARDALSAGGRLEIATGEAEYGESDVPPGGRCGRYVWIRVRDEGAGIDPAVLPHIFEPFFTTKEKGKGTGLGLAKAHGIVEQHDGWIAVASEVGKGAEFRVYLPRADRLPQGAPGEAVAGSSQAGVSGGETILVAEDEESVRDFLCEVLEGSGRRVLLAGDGEEAIQRFDEHREGIDLVLLDVIMPRKNGREVYDYIKSREPDARVVFMSGYTRDILSSKGLQEQGLRLLQKPLTMQRVLDEVRSALAKAT